MARSGQTSALQQICQLLGVQAGLRWWSGEADHPTWLRQAGFWIFSIPRLVQERIQVRLPPMSILIITEKTSQARDLRAALGDRDPRFPHRGLFRDRGYGQSREWHLPHVPCP